MIVSLPPSPSPPPHHATPIIIQALGAVDYLTLSQYFHTVLIRNVPQMSVQIRTEARRFITLIDTFYDHHVRVVVSADTGIEELFSKKKHTNVEPSDDDRKLMDDLGIQLGDVWR